MPTYTFKIASVCSGGGHITLHILKDGAITKTIQTTKEEVAQSDSTVLDAVTMILRQAVRDNNADTKAKIKTAIEGVVINV